MYITEDPGSVHAMDSRKMKRVSVSSKRQISIPKEFYDALGIEKEISMELVNNRLIIKPIKDSFDDFSEEILADIIREGYEGASIMKEFKNRKSKLKPAIYDVISETSKQNSTTVDDLFTDDGEDDETL